MSSGGDVQRLEVSYTIGGKTKQYIHFGNRWQFLVILDIHHLYPTALLFLARYPREKHPHTEQ